MQLQFQFRFTKDSEEVLFAFCFPYSYEDCGKDLERCEDQVCFPLALQYKVEIRLSRSRALPKPGMLFSLPYKVELGFL